MNGHGGKRDGAGRKAGSKTSKERELARAAAEQGITPLEVMLAVMRDHYDKKRFDDAAAIAKDAAPYIHPRLSAASVSGPDGGEIPLGIRFVDSLPPADDAGTDAPGP
jgi:hypothetical protein